MDPQKVSHLFKGNLDVQQKNLVKKIVLQNDKFKMEIQELNKTNNNVISILDKTTFKYNDFRTKFLTMQ